MISTKNVANKKVVLPFVIVVEGKTDTLKLQQLFDVYTIETNGSCLNKQTLTMIKECLMRQIPIVFFTDPDAAGTKIRNRLNQHFPNQINLFLQMQDMQKGSKKIGVAECRSDVLKRLLLNVNMINDSKVSDLKWDDFLNHDLLFNKKLKNHILTYYHLPAVNNKRLLQYLQLLKVTKKEFEYVISQFKK